MRLKTGGQHLGMVEAPDEKSATAKAAEQLSRVGQ
jgi:hypothetical protein